MAANHSKCINFRQVGLFYLRRITAASNHNITGYITDETIARMASAVIQCVTTAIEQTAKA